MVFYLRRMRFLHVQFIKNGKLAKDEANVRGQDNSGKEDGLDSTLPNFEVIVIVSDHFREPPK